MGLYSLALKRSSVSGAGTAIWELIPAGSKRIRLLEMGRFANQNGNTMLALGRPTTAGVTPTSPVTFLAENPNDPSSITTLASAWVTAPVSPTSFLMYGLVPIMRKATVWQFPGGIVFGPSSTDTLALWNRRAAGTAQSDWYFVTDG